MACLYSLTRSIVTAFFIFLYSSQSFAINHYSNEIFELISRIDSLKMVTSISGGNEQNESMQHHLFSLDNFMLRQHVLKGAQGQLKFLLRNGINSWKDRQTSECLNNSSSSACYISQQKKYLKVRKYLFGHLHLKGRPEKYFIKDIYCNRRFTKNDFPKGKGAPAPNKIPFFKVLNTEHIWPQSRFSKKIPRYIQKTDLHILYPSGATINIQRSNLSFNNVIRRTARLTCKKSQKGTSRSISQIFFEPPDNVKGNVARAMFYFSLQYGMSLSKRQVKTFKKWSKIDPVDDFEATRNDKIYKNQENRNPFIDHDMLVDYIDFQ